MSKIEQQYSFWSRMVWHYVCVCICVCVCVYVCLCVKLYRFCLLRYSTVLDISV